MMHVMKRFSGILILLVGVIFFVHADTNELDRFATFIKNMKVVKIGFTQQVHAYDGTIMSSGKGMMWYKPDRFFRIEYTVPEKETIITNDNGYKIYNFEDKEESGGRLEDIVFVSPFTMLRELRVYFTVHETAKRMYRLESKGDITGDIASIMCEFAGNKKFPKVMTVYMKSGSMVKYMFQSMIEDVDQPGLFSFAQLKKAYGSK